MKLCHYEKGTVIVQENEPCTSIGFVINGHLTAHQIAPDGKSLTINTFSSNDAFGVALYSLQNPMFPFNVHAQTESDVVYIPFSEIQKLISTNTIFSTNFIHFLSLRIYDFKNKIQMLQHNDVRSRLIKYLTSESREIGSTTFNLRHSKVAISDMIGVARPSVSRELKNMVDDNLINIYRNKIVLVDQSRFR